MKKVAEKQYDDDGWEIATPKKSFKKHTSPAKTKETKTDPAEEIKAEETTLETESVVENEVEKVTESIEQVQLETPETEHIPLTEDTDSDSDGGEWITPDNVDEYKAAEIGVTAAELKNKEKMAVGCMTADFAMQNVLLQMNLNLVSAGGYRVKKIRNSVMRCHACFL